jgi:hypothetical protein
MNSKVKELPVKSFCRNCRQDTFHKQEGLHRAHGDPDVYSYLVEYTIISCLGCETVSFRKEFHDHEQSYPTGDNEWENPITVDYYPKLDKGNIETPYLPDIVANIYNETCAAFREDALTLAGIGFRATIEAICNDQGIAGRELSTRIGNLSIKGLISKKDANRLHSIRFLGNDAAHEIKRPSAESIQGSLRIS